MISLETVVGLALHCATIYYPLGDHHKLYMYVSADWLIRFTYWPLMGLNHCGIRNYNLFNSYGSALAANNSILDNFSRVFRILNQLVWYDLTSTGSVIYKIRTKVYPCHSHGRFHLVNHQIKVTYYLYLKFCETHFQGSMSLFRSAVLTLRPSLYCRERIALYC